MRSSQWLRGFLETLTCFRVDFDSLCRVGGNRRRGRRPATRSRGRFMGRNTPGGIGKATPAGRRALIALRKFDTIATETIPLRPARNRRHTTLRLRRSRTEEGEIALRKSDQTYEDCALLPSGPRRQTRQRRSLRLFISGKGGGPYAHEQPAPWATRASTEAVPRTATVAATVQTAY
jgi:hypothetical protein